MFSFLISCTNKRKNIEYIIHGGKFKLWDIYKLDNGKYVSTGSTFMLSSDNKAYYLRSSNYRSKKLKPFYFNDVSFDNKWYINYNIDTIQIDYEKYKIISVKTDTIVLLLYDKWYLIEATNKYKDFEPPQPEHSTKRYRDYRRFRKYYF